MEVAGVQVWFETGVDDYECRQRNVPKYDAVILRHHSEQGFWRVTLSSV